QPLLKAWNPVVQPVYQGLLVLEDVEVPQGHGRGPLPGRSGLCFALHGQKASSAWSRPPVSSRGAGLGLPPAARRGAASVPRPFTNRKILPILLTVYHIPWHEFC